MQSAGFENETAHFGTLENPPAPPAGGHPGLLLLGEAAAPRFRYREHGALGGKRVWVTGSQAMQQQAARQIRRYGGIPVSQPLVRVVPRNVQLPDLQSFDWLVLSAPYSVTCLLELVPDLRQLPQIMACGAATQALLKQQLQPDAVPHHGFSDQGVTRSLQELAPPESRILRLRSEAAGPGMADCLQKHFSAVSDVVLFHSEPVPCDAPPECDAILVASDLAAEVLLDTCGAEWINQRTCAVLGRRDAAALQKRGIGSAIAPPEKATTPAAIRALAAHAVRQKIFHNQPTAKES